MFGFGGVRIERTDVPEYRESDIDDDEQSWYPPFVEIDPGFALQRVDREFERAREAPWTRVYTSHWEKLCAEYERFRAVVAGEQESELCP